MSHEDVDTLTAALMEAEDMIDTLRDLAAHWKAIATTERARADFYKDMFEHYKMLAKDMEARK